MTRLAGAFLFAAALLFSADALAGGQADKVTGTYVHAACVVCPPGTPVEIVYGKEISAHEAIDGRLQKGFIYILRPDGITWDLIDLGNGAMSCVNVYEDGKARIGGLVVDGTGPGLGRIFGLEIEDKGEPGAWSDLTTTLRFMQNWEGFQDWCATGNRDGADRVWPHIVIEGNVQVHNYPTDGD